MRRQFVSMVLGAALCVTGGIANAQSVAPSRATALSVQSASAIPAATREFMAAGGNLSVAALRPAGESMVVVLAAGADGGAFALRVSADAIIGTGVAVGTAVTATAVAGGYLLEAGGSAIAFVPEAMLGAMAHRREIRR